MTDGDDQPLERGYTIFVSTCYGGVFQHDWQWVTALHHAGVIEHGLRRLLALCLGQAGVRTDISFSRCVQLWGSGGHRPGVWAWLLQDTGYSGSWVKRRAGWV
jgi:hypothetical protein